MFKEPTWRELYWAVRASAQSESVIRGFWRRGTDTTYLLSQASHALGLICRWWLAEHKRPPNVWFPDYMCESSLAVVRGLGAGLRFYPVTPTLTPNWSACERMAAAGPPDLLVLVHYFGRANRGRDARAFCDRTGAYLIEDGAHVLMPVGEIGDFGDFVCYSPRKFFCIPDGGILLVKDAGLAGAFDARLSEASALAPETSGWMWRGVRRNVKRPFRARTSGPKSRAAPTIDTDPPDVPPFDGPWMSETSKRILAASISKGRARLLAEQHLGRDRQLRGALMALLGWQALFPYSEAEIPLLTVMRCKSEEIAALHMARLQRDGAKAITWPRLPREVKGDPKRHATALRLRRTLLLFPLVLSNRSNPLAFLSDLSVQGP